MSTIWAYSSDAPGRTCKDARLLGSGTKLQYPAGNDSGQAGWDVGMMFNNIGDLSGKLRDLANTNQEPITRLSINVHGSPGKIDADSVGTEANMYDFKKLWWRYSSPLVFINHMLAAGATVLIMGCNVASGDEGAAFLADLSRDAFPHHKVVGFTTVGETLGQFRRGEYCSEPGMRDTPYDNSSEGMPTLKAQRENEYLTLPWASEFSPHAKVALDGQIIAGAEPTLGVDYSFDRYLPGTWSVTIGPWKGYFVFEEAGKVYWTDEAPTRRHQGQWGTMAGSIEWSFSDDEHGWQRNFQVLTPLKSTVNGNITIRGVDHGFFTMSKQ